ncbi:MAG: hypothetical protein K8I02_11030 [Candidatus Methylomirabilis sp.]|nr:hypothetical protein [Deltaproteobacteria bacterium]
MKRTKTTRPAETVVVILGLLSAVAAPFLAVWAATRRPAKVPEPRR